MKISNKLLLLTALIPLVSLGLVHLDLYSHYKAGKFVTGRQLHAERYERKEFPLPLVLLVKGVDNIRIIPSDTFAVEYNKGFIADRAEVIQEDAQSPTNPPALHSYRKGDTLEIMGYDTLLMKNNPDQAKITSFPSIILYCRGIRTMDFEGANVTILQQKRSALPSASLLIVKNGYCKLGEPETDPPGAASYNYDALRMKSVNSSIFLHPNAVIRDLQLELDSASYIDDNAARIGSLDIRCSDRSQLKFQAANLTKLKIITDSLR